LNPLYSFFVNLADSNGNVIAQYNGNPCSPLLPAEIIAPGAFLLGKTPVEIPPGTAEGDYTMTMGIINWQTGEQVTLEGAAQSEVFIGTIQVGSGQ
jgi:hypothetical protein